jgi:Transposase DDE domain group 1
MRAPARTARHRLAGLIRQSVFGRLAGYEDVNDADLLCRDPAMRWVVGDREIAGSAASASQMGRFETRWLTRRENLAALTDLPGQWIDKVHQRSAMSSDAPCGPATCTALMAGARCWSRWLPAHQPDRTAFQDCSALFHCVLLALLYEGPDRLGRDQLHVVSKTDQHAAVEPRWALPPAMPAFRWSPISRMKSNPCSGKRSSPGHT